MTSSPATVDAAGDVAPFSPLPPFPPARARAHGLTWDQYEMLCRPVGRWRIGIDGKGYSHVKGWGVRRDLIRIFGFGGFAIEELERTLVHERETPQPPNEDGEPQKPRWTVVYRVAVRLTATAPDGTILGPYDGSAIGEAINQPGWGPGEAHDLALKTAATQAVKRAAINFGDNFGLSLYDAGALDARVRSSLIAPDRPAGHTEQAGQVPTVDVDEAAAAFYAALFREDGKVKYTKEQLRGGSRYKAAKMAELLDKVAGVHDGAPFTLREALVDLVARMDADNIDPTAGTDDGVPDDLDIPNLDGDDTLASCGRCTIGLLESTGNHGEGCDERL